MINQELCIRGIKFSYIGYVASLFTIFGIILSLCYNELMNYLKLDITNIHKKDPNKIIKDNILFTKFVFSTLIDSVVVSIIAYILRHIVREFPYPLAGVCGFDPNRVAEVKGGVILASILMAFNQYKDKLVIYKHIWKKDKTRFAQLIAAVFIITFGINYGIGYLVKFIQ